MFAHFCFQFLMKTRSVVCSEEHFKSDNALLKEAFLRDKVSIVTYDWLEDSIISRRKLATTKYEWAKIMKRKNQKKGARKKAETQKLKKDAQVFQDGVAAAR